MSSESPPIPEPIWRVRDFLDAGKTGAVMLVMVITLVAVKAR